MPDTQTIPKALIYEMDGDRPVYYRGYKDVLAGSKSIEEVRSSNQVQGFLIVLLVSHLSKQLPEQYLIGINKIGIQLGQSYRVADVAIFNRSKIDDALENTYAHEIPEVVLEVDTKHDQSDHDDDTDTAYIHRKTDALLMRGVRQVIWIFTKSRKITVATSSGPWLTSNWDAPVDVLGASLLLISLVTQLEMGGGTSD